MPKNIRRQPHRSLLTAIVALCCRPRIRMRSRHPASLTKIMPLYLLFERLEAGKIKIETEGQTELQHQIPTER
jgi:hypothetical protein